MNFKNPVVIITLITSILGIVGAIFLKDYWRMAALIVSAVSLIVLIKLTIGKNTGRGPDANLPTSPGDVTTD